MSQDGPAENTAPHLEVIQGGRKSGQQVVGDFLVPYGYELWADGTYKTGDGASPEAAEPSVLRTPPPKHRAWLDAVASRPIWLVRRANALDSKEALYEIAALAAEGGVLTTWESRGNLADGRRIVSCLASKGFPVRSGNAQAVERYFDRAIHANAVSLPVHAAAARSGAYEVTVIATSADGSLAPGRAYGWLLGDEWIGPPGTTVCADRRHIIGWMKGLTRKGDLASWLRIYQSLNEIGPVARWLTGTTFAAPLLRLVGHRTFLVHHWGASGSGKTALLRFAMTAWGDPQLLVAHHNRTEKSYAEVFAYVSDLPVAFDELQAGTDNSPLAYILGAERGRSRAAAQGGLEEETLSWRTIIRMTGEEPVIGRGRLNLGGEGARVVELGRAVLEPENARDLNVWATRGPHGLAGPQVLRWLIDSGVTVAGDGLLEALYRAVVDALPLELAQGRAAHIAVVALGQAIAEHVLVGTTLDRALTRAIEDGKAVGEVVAEEEGAHESVADRALQLIRDHMLSRRFEWLDVHDAVSPSWSNRQVFGVIADSELWLIQAAANRLLVKEGLPPRRVWADLAGRGVLVSDGSARAQPRALGVSTIKVYVLRRDCM